MKRIIWHDPIQVTHIDGTPVPSGEDNPLRFERFLMQRLTDQSFGQSMDRLLAALKIRDVINQGAFPAEGGAYLELEDADHALLKSAVETPSTPWNPTFAHSIVPFMKAVTEAK